LNLAEDTDLIRTAIMGENGADVQLSSAIRDQFPYAIECKNQEKFKTLYTIMSQAEDHATGKDLRPMAFLKMNRQKPLVVMYAEDYFDDRF
jgi:hypothetical protein